MNEFVTTQWLALGAVSIVIWFLKRTLDRAEDSIKANEARAVDIEKDVQLIKLDYLHKTEFKDFKAELRGMFEEIRTDIRSLHAPQ